MSEADERERGILSQADREYLDGHKELSEQGERDTRYRIRKRVKNAILDFPTVGQLSENDIELISEDIKPDNLVDCMIFFYDFLIISSEDMSEAQETFEAILETAIGAWHNFHDEEYIIKRVDINIQIEKQKANLEEITKRYYQDEATIDELNYLLDSDEFDGEKTLVKDRILKHWYKEGGIPDGLVSQILESSDVDNLDAYFELADKAIKEEWEKRHSTNEE